MRALLRTTILYLCLVSTTFTAPIRVEPHLEASMLFAAGPLAAGWLAFMLAIYQQKLTHERLVPATVMPSNLAKRGK